MSKRSKALVPQVSLKKPLAGLEEILGVSPAPAALFLEALTHSSYANEQPAPRPADNERLEFLGDAVIGLAVAHVLWHRFPDRPEGELARALTALVNTRTLAEVGRSLGLGRRLLIGKGEVQSGGQDRDSLLCDAFEALVGAVFAAYGWNTAVDFVLRHLADPLQGIESEEAPGLDAKTQLQERLHLEAAESPQYVVTDAAGPAHRRLFTVDAVWQGKPIGTGRGSSKRAAEQAAAAEALCRLSKTLEHETDSRSGRGGPTGI